MPRVLLWELQISGLHGMMTWTTKYLCVLLTLILQLHGLVDFNYVIVDCLVRQLTY